MLFCEPHNKKMLFCEPHNKKCYFVSPIFFSKNSDIHTLNNNEIPYKEPIYKGNSLVYKGIFILCQ